MNKTFSKLNFCNKWLLIMSMILIIIIFFWIICNLKVVDEIIWQDKKEKKINAVQNQIKNSLPEERFFSDWQTPESRKYLNDLASGIKTYFSVGNVTGINIYNKDKILIWTDLNPDNLGITSEQNELDAAISGKIISVKSSEGKNLYEFYVPVDTGNQTLAVLELYINAYDVTILANKIYAFIFILFTVFLTLFTLIYFYLSKKSIREYVAKSKQFDILFDDSPLGIYILDKYGIIESFNPEMLKMAGCAKSEEIIGINALKLKTYKDAGLDEYFKKGLKGEKFETEVNYTSFSCGKTTTRHYVGCPIFSDGQKVDKLLLIVEDITEKKGMESKLASYATELEKTVGARTSDLSSKIKELSDTEKAMLNILEDLEEEKFKLEKQITETMKFQKTVENSNEGMMILNSEGNIIYSNHALQKMTGYDKSEIFGRKPIVWSKNLGLKLEDILEKIKKNKRTVIIETQNNKKNGSKYDSMITIFPILSKGKEDIDFFVWIERDITRLKEVDRAKTEFVSLASHQLRTPLTSINWYSEMLLGGDAGKLDKNQKDFIEEVYRSSKRMSELVNSLLNVSRIEMGTFIIEPKPVDVKKLSKDVIRELTLQVKAKSLKIEEDYDNKIPEIMADQNILRIILQNLITNAVKYTPNKGKIIISMKKDSHNAIINIRDSGIGIPKKDQSKLFQKFFRSDLAKSKDPDGTGLGLYIVKEIVDEAGGKIWFKSHEGKGTSFYVSIPLRGMKSKTGTKKLT